MAAATAEESFEVRSNSRLQPPPDPDAFQGWLTDLRTKVNFCFLFLQLSEPCTNDDIVEDMLGIPRELAVPFFFDFQIHKLILICKNTNNN